MQLADALDSLCKSIHTANIKHILIGCIFFIAKNFNLFLVMRLFAEKNKGEWLLPLINYYIPTYINYQPFGIVAPIWSNLLYVAL